MIKVIDIFAGPGGLGEGFSSFRSSRADRRFELAVSIEKDPLAHRTLRLRAFVRQFDGRRLPKSYYEHLREEISWEQLADGFPVEAAHASREAVCLTLGPGTVCDGRGHISAAIKKTENWVLIGGPHVNYGKRRTPRPVHQGLRICR